MNREKRKIILCAFIMACIGALLSVPFFAAAGDLEPPSIAVDGNGDPVSTTMTPPSWGKKLPADERFELVLDDEAVLDKETGLVWERSPDTTMRIWWLAISDCYMNTVAHRKGWRLPTIAELSSLVDPTHVDPALPSGHPFANVVQSALYWSSTTNADHTSTAWVVSFYSGGVGGNAKTNFSTVWCVRGGQGYDAY